ncbi:MAG TPA: pyruvate dehydrogenase (acetyl-transferring) E1 component subunit alpha [Spongiibacteraceae bacterium]|nr:pyruvate dehydrogenase (acetyl-transferring) E1 component subunit alpha [Spongiibacteraceae bacterium]
MSPEKPANDPSPAQQKQWLYAMLRIRRFEEKCAQLYGQMKIRGFLHLYIGEEAIAAGVMPALAPEDAIVATYREHGHALLRGVSMNSILAEMYGKQEGCCRGHGGSMHLFDATKHFYGGNAIVAGGLPLAVGLALADKMQKKNHVSACFFGEGAAAEGEFHESLNLAALWKLPVLFLCENNLYAMGTALARSESEIDIHKKAASYGIASTVVDGMDVGAVDSAARTAIAAIRNGAGPQFLELRTYRFRAHSMFDAELYRSKQEVEEWKRHCPIETLSQRLLAESVIKGADVEKFEADIDKEIADAIAFAEAGAWESIADLTRNVYTETNRVYTEVRA